MELKGRAIAADGSYGESFGPPKILVVGCGGGGSNTISRLHKMGLSGAQTIAINTDAQHLSMVDADCKLLIGSRLTKGLGCGGNLDIGTRAAEMAAQNIRRQISGADMVFVTAGMGGGTGTGAAPVVARIARESAALVIGMVTTPFHIERARVLVAEEGLANLRAHIDTLIVLDNNRLLELAPDLPIDDAFSVVDLLMAEIIKGITETITEPSIINLDYADVKTIMKSGGPSFMVVGEGTTGDRPEDIVDSAINNPLLDVDCSEATGCLLHITGGSDLTLIGAAALASCLTKELHPRANVIWGARIKDGFEGRIRLMAIITGVLSEQVLTQQREVDTHMDEVI
jgi:cell division protein FtsZ